MENGVDNHNNSSMAVINKEEGEPHMTSNHNRRARESTPVVSLLKLYKGKEEQGRRKQQHHQDEGRRHHLNNNNPDTANRNLKHAEARRGTPSTVPYPTAHTNPNPRHPPVQVPQFPYFPRQVIGPSALTSYYPTSQPPSRLRSYYRPRYVSTIQLFFF